MTGQDLAILNRLYQAQPEHLQRNAESQVACLELRVKIRLGKGAAGNRGIVRTAAHGPELMNTAISGAVGVKLESHFTDGAELRFKRRDNVQPTETMGNEAELRILCRLRSSVGRVRNDEPARSTQDRVSMAHKTLVGVEP